MSINLINLAKKFVTGEISAQNFSDDYIAAWNAELDANLLKDDAVNLSVCASTIFILADNFNPESDRTAGELDEASLKFEVSATLKKLS